MNSGMLQPEDALGRYVIERFVASGGMGAVYRARGPRGEHVAIKVLFRGLEARHSLLPGGVEQGRFAQEVRLLSQQDHPGIVRYIGHGTSEEGDPYLVMEWLDGRSLDTVFRERTLTGAEARTLALRVAEALASVHAAGIVHRDIKPSNIFLPNGSIERCKLIDFGIAHTDRAELSAAGELMGTFKYMSPEQARSEEVDARSDVWGLGVVLFRALVGRLPFEAENALAVLGKIQADDPPHVCWERPDVPLPLGDLVARMMAKQRDDRPRDGAAVVRILSAMDHAPPSQRTSILDRARQIVSVVAVESAKDMELLRSAAAPFAAEVVPIGQGAVLAILTGRQDARDQAIQAARLALALRHVGWSRMALCTGHAEVERGSRVGEAIDGAMRLLASVPQMGMIRIDDATAGLIRGSFEVHDGFLQTRPRARPEHVGPFVGRTEEVSKIVSALRERTGACLVVGEAGTGKTRLSERVVEVLEREDRDLHVAHARGDPLGAGAAFAMISQALRSMLGVWGGTLKVRRACIRGRVSEHVPASEVDRISEMLGELVGVPFDESPRLRTARRDPAAMQDQLRAALTDFVRAECLVAPWLLVLEDIQWADLPSVKLVEAALDRGGRFCVLALARPSALDLFPKLWKQHRRVTISLGPLDDRSCEELARAITNRSDVTSIVRRAAGNPLFLEELARSGDLAQSVVAILASRVEVLDGAEKRALRAASVFGDGFGADDVHALVGPCAEVLERLERAGWIVRRDDAFAFRHDLMRNAAYDTLTARDRKDAHARAGAFLESREGIEPLVIAEHFERAGDVARAAPHFLLASRRAIDGNDFTHALDCTKRGLVTASSSRPELMLARAEALRWSGSTREGAACAIEAVAEIERASMRWFDACSEIVWSSGYAGAYDAVAEWSDRIAETAPASGAERAKLLCLARAGTHLIHGDRIEHAKRIGAHVEALATPRLMRDPIARAWAHLLRAWLAYYEADFDRYVRGQREVAMSFESAGDLRNACREWINVGHALMEIGAWDECIEVTRPWRDWAEQMQLPIVAAQATQNIGYALGQKGSIVEAIAELERSRRFPTTNARHAIGSALYVAAIAMRAGDFARAEKEARAALEGSKNIPTLLAQSHAALASALFARARVDEAIDHAGRAHDLIVQIGTLEERDLSVRWNVIEVLRAIHDPRAATMLAAAKRAVMERRVPETYRNAWLAIPEHARILAS